MLYDLHTHTFLSDGSLSPMEMIRRAKIAGYDGIALTDHVGCGGMARILAELKADCALAEKHWGIRCLAGVELTHVPALAIHALAAQAKELGAEIVVVHGESPVEPVEPGTNHAAASCPLVDILAHPGFITLDEAKLAASNGVFLEISARGGHNTANGHVVAVGRAAGAQFLVDSDAHEPEDLLDDAWAKKVALGAGLSDLETGQCLTQAPLALITP